MKTSYDEVSYSYYLKFCWMPSLVFKSVVAERTILTMFYAAHSYTKCVSGFHRQNFSCRLLQKAAVHKQV
jgi:hypothetical protein